MYLRLRWEEHVTVDLPRNITDNGNCRNQDRNHPCHRSRIENMLGYVNKGEECAYIRTSSANQLQCAGKGKIQIRK